MVVFGDVIDDVIVAPAGPIRPDTDTRARIERRSGGSAANAAAWFALSGRPVDFFGHVAMADVGRHSEELAVSGVRAHLTGSDELPTGTIIVILDDERSRTMLTDTGANVLTGPRDVDRALFAPGSHLHFTGYSVFRESGESSADDFLEVIRDARSRGTSVSFNPGSAGFLVDHGPAALLAATRGAHLCIPNLDEGRVLTGASEPGDVLAALLEHYELVALTLGRGGVLAGVRGQDPVHVEARLVDPVDTTGAGDSFSAAFVSELLASGPVVDRDSASISRAVDADRLRSAAVAGTAAAARAITQLGARPQPAHGLVS
ncbi:PfkB family carbohydrate kinase [Herbiconiux sp.]|uniref:carbohydrate kinase family protein n=1 Tax=Herbiconiux sp. TaxID=1871186 RepID=UPI0025C652E1|nr:PfkB family carbohydrate kinase [Herbiconiux sp.]